MKRCKAVSTTQTLCILVRRNFFWWETHESFFVSIQILVGLGPARHATPREHHRSAQGLQQLRRPLEDGENLFRVAFRFLFLRLSWKCNGYGFIFSYIKRQVLTSGRTGRVAFDDNGDRLFSEYDIVNVQNRGPPVDVGKFFYSKVSIFSLAASPVFSLPSTIWKAKPSTHQPKTCHWFLRVSLPLANQRGFHLNQDPPMSPWNRASLLVGGRVQYQDTLKLSINDSQIVWPGQLKGQKPEGFQIPTFLKVMTIVEQPFVYARPIDVDAGQGCNQLHGEVLCPWFNNSGTGWIRFKSVGFGWILLSLAEVFGFSMCNLWTDVTVMPTGMSFHGFDSVFLLNLE